MSLSAKRTIVASVFAVNVSLFLLLLFDTGYGSRALKDKERNGSAFKFSFGKQKVTLVPVKFSGKRILEYVNLYVWYNLRPRGYIVTIEVILNP